MSRAALAASAAPIAWLLARLGAHVVVAGRSGAKLETALSGNRQRAAWRRAAASSTFAIRNRWRRSSTDVWADHGRLDSIVNSAGGQFPQPAIDFSVKGWNAVINTNLNGTWYMMQAAAQRWREAEQPGSIVNIVVVTTHGLYGVAHSIAARAGVIGLSRSVAVEWAPLGIRVNCVAPGAIETEGWKVYTRGGARGLSALQPDDARRLGLGHRRSLRLSRRPRGGFVTGELLTVDGGGQLWGETWTTGKPDYFEDR